MRLLYLFLCLYLLTPCTGARAQSLEAGSRPPADTLAPGSSREAPFLSEYNQAFYPLDELNVGLPPAPATANLLTPQGALEFFIRYARRGSFDTAAHALNLNLLPADFQLDRAAILAEKLHYVIRQRIPLDWSELPDRPDGQVNRGGSSQANLGQPQRTIPFGNLDIDGRAVTLNLQRVRVGEQAPRWVVSASTVENIEPLYAAYGPSAFSRSVPTWARTRVLGLPVWKLVGSLLLALVCYLLGRMIYWLIARAVRRTDAEWANDLGEKMASPLALAAGSLLFYVAMNDVLSVAGGWSPYLYSLLLVVVIICITWLIMRIIDYVIERVTDTQVADVSDEDNLESRRMLTYLSVGRWVFTAVIIAVGIGVVIGQFPELRNIGVSLMASAGIATVILGIAAQSTLGNIVAGLQIAITKPARIGDSVITSNGEYGTVEDIRFTYLVVKTWDGRRLVIPLKYFIDHPFQNWSMNDPHMLKPIVLHVDFFTDVEKLRAKFDELCRANENWDEESEPSTQVVGSDKEALEVRFLCSAKDAPTAWTLHVELREAMAKYLAELQNGKRLARERIEVVD